MSGRAAFGLVLSCLVACSSDARTFPVRAAPPFRHLALESDLAVDARAFAFADGDWLEDTGDAPYFGLAWLARRAAAGHADATELARRDAAATRARRLLESDPLDRDLFEPMMAALGLVAWIAASGDRRDVPLVDAFLDRLDARLRRTGDYVDGPTEGSASLRALGPTAVTALAALVFAEAALSLGGELATERVERARAIDAAIVARALTDLVDGETGASVRAYAFAPGFPGLSEMPNLFMLLLKARLYRLTDDLGFRLETRAVLSALQPLKLTDVPARYTSPSARGRLGLDTRDLTTLTAQSYLALGLLFAFEVTGESRFVDEADRVVDAIALMRGPWCASQVSPAACSAPCGEGTACVSGACAPERCTTGLLDHVVSGRLARPEDGALFSSGGSLQVLYVLGYRHTLAGEPW